MPPKQAASRLHLVSSAGLILPTDRSEANQARENAMFARQVGALQQEKRILLKKKLIVERIMRSSRKGEHKVKDEMTIFSPPHLFFEFAMM